MRKLDEDLMKIVQGDELDWVRGLELKQSGTFDAGVYRRNPGVPGRRNVDAYPARRLSPRNSAFAFEGAGRHERDARRPRGDQRFSMTTRSATLSASTTR